MKKAVLVLCAAAAVVFAAIQVVPASRVNPPVEVAVAWDSPRTRELFFAACADCHSNETVWPWYGRIAPVSWFVRDHVLEGREDFNISTDTDVEVDDVVRQIRKGKMPLASYTWLHPAARLDEQEKQELIRGLEKTF